ncbi:hypothetical protein [Streptomyces sp. NPDC001480]|uniref:hypothetical protein n=1 Tax=Streptomyces sp. NPDC001480 TaxID=3364577 RepID=UPI00367F9362
MRRLIRPVQGAHQIVPSPPPTRAGHPAVKGRLKQIQYCPDPVDAFLAATAFVPGG